MFRLSLYLLGGTEIRLKEEGADELLTILQFVSNWNSSQGDPPVTDTSD